MENDLKTNNAIDETYSSLFPIFTEEEEFVFNFIKKHCDYYSQKVIAIFDVLQTYIKKVYGIDTVISTNDINKFAEVLLDKVASNTPDHYFSKKHLVEIHKIIKNTFYLEVKEYIAEFEKKSILIFRNNVIDKSNQKNELQNNIQLLYEVKNVRNKRKLFSDYEIEINKLLPDSQEFILSDEEYYFSIWLYNLDNSLNQFVNNILDTLEIKLNSDIEYLKEFEVFPQDPATKTPKEFRYFKKVNDKYTLVDGQQNIFTYCIYKLKSKFKKDIPVKRNAKNPITILGQQDIFNFKKEQFKQMGKDLNSFNREDLELIKENKDKAKQMIVELESILKERNII